MKKTLQKIVLPFSESACSKIILKWFVVKLWMASYSYFLPNAPLLSEKEGCLDYGSLDSTTGSRSTGSRSNNTWHPWRGAVEGERGTGQCHQMSHGEGQPFFRFSNFFSFIFVFWTFFERKKNRSKFCPEEHKYMALLAMVFLII